MSNARFAIIMSMLCGIKADLNSGWFSLFMASCGAILGAFAIYFFINEDRQKQ